MSDFDTMERPNRIPWPPLLLVLAIASGYLLTWAISVSLLPAGAAETFGRWLGTLMIVGAIGLDVWALVLFKKHNTTILPHQGSNHIVSTGPFGFSRNPIYVGNLAIVAGLGLRANSPWFFLALIPMAYFVRKLAIEREEAHLSARFAEEWAAYSARVNRWLGRSKPKPNRSEA